MERTIFGDASGDCLASVVKIDTGVEGADPVSVGGLSCWEHIQPLLKYYTFSQGEQVHVAAWPPLDPCPDESPGFWSMSADGELVFLNVCCIRVQPECSFVANR
jgi:nitrilase